MASGLQATDNAEAAAADHARDKTRAKKGHTVDPNGVFDAHLVSLAYGAIRTEIWIRYHNDPEVGHSGANTTIELR